MSDTLPLRVDGKALRAPTAKPPKKPGKPAWSDYKPKTPVRCDHCAQVAYESLQAGEGFVGTRQARMKRRHDGENLLLCAEHANLQRELDKADYAHIASEVRPNRKQRYLA